MASVADIARLNVLIELFSECASAADLPTLLRLAAGRLRWVLDFDRCTFAIERPEGRVCWIATHAEEKMHEVLLVELPEPEATLVHRVLESGAPAGNAPFGICVPLQVADRTLGALSFSTDVGRYSYRDMRLAHHAGQYLGSVISRMDLEDETRALSKRKDELLAVLSHELRNPLAPIVTAVHLLKMRSDGQPTKELDVIERQAEHLVRLVDDLLDVARLTRGKVVLHRGAVELSDVVALAVEMASPLLEERRHSLVVDVPKGLILDADRNRLAQVVSNLLTNAAHYTAAGGHVGVKAYRDGETVVVEVSDDGVGISSEALSNIFDLFVQGPTRSSGQGGLGLGLVVVKQLAELHGGSVTVASEGNGHGAKFTVRLPVLAAGVVVSVVAATSYLVPVAAAPHRVLLVDDNDDALDVLSLVVESGGHQVFVARDGVSALSALDRFRPTVAVIDISMPVMDGFELAAHIRARHDSDPPHLVALTGYGQAVDRERTHAAGFDEHLVKPIDIAHLLRVIALVPTRAAAPVLASPS